MKKQRMIESILFGTIAPIDDNKDKNFYICNHNTTNL